MLNTNERQKHGKLAQCSLMLLPAAIQIELFSSLIDRNQLQLSSIDIRELVFVDVCQQR